MRNLIYVMLVVFLPLTLASDTQHRFKVHVGVNGDDKTTTGILTSHLKRELRALGDVDIVGWTGDWKYTIRVFYHEIKTKGGVKTGNLAIASITEARLYKHYLKDFVQQDIIKPVLPGTLGVAYWPKDDLQEWCISTVGAFNDDELDSVRLLNSIQIE